jgi:signal recognition particle receptor subunit beta
MVTINYAFREISCKIVYYGPGLSGKTTNLQYVHGRVPSKSRGDLISLATETDRTLYFDFLPIHVGDIAGFSTKFQLYTVPGQVFYNATRKLVLRGVDGIVFVADSQTAKMDENIESLSNMYENLRENGITVADIPLIFQYNKRDLPDVAGIEELERTINPEGRPYVEAAAVNGSGVFDTRKRITKLVLEQTKKRTAVSPGSVSVEAAEPAAEVVGVTTGPQPVVAGMPMREPERAVAAGQISSGRDATAVIGTAVPEASRPEGPRKPTVSEIPPGHSRPGPIAHGVRAPQRSLRVLTRQRSIWSRLFGWLFGR